MKKLFKILLILIFVGLIGGTGYLGYKYQELRKAHAELQEQLAKVEKQKDMLQERYKAQKALEANLMRSKRALESKIGELLADAKKLKAENEVLRTNITGKLKEENDALRAKLSQAIDVNKKIISEYKTEKAKFAKTEKELKLKINQLQAKNKSLETQVTRTNFQFLRCRDHNEKLVDITETLLLAYENKGMMGSLLQKEPLTNIQQVQVEKFIQEYQDKIEKEKIE